MSDIGEKSYVFPPGLRLIIGDGKPREVFDLKFYPDGEINMSNFKGGSRYRQSRHQVRKPCEVGTFKARRAMRQEKRRPITFLEIRPDLKCKGLVERFDLAQLAMQFALPPNLVTPPQVD